LIPRIPGIPFAVLHSDQEYEEYREYEGDEEYGLEQAHSPAVRFTGQVNSIPKVHRVGLRRHH